MMRQEGKRSPMQRRTGAGGCTQHECRTKIKTPQQYVARGLPAKDLSWVKVKRAQASRGSKDWDISIRKCGEQHRLGLSGPGKRAEEVIPEKGNCHRGAQARNARTFE